MYDYERERERKSKNNLKKKILLSLTFSNHQNLLSNSNFFTEFKFSPTFHYFQETSTLFTFVYICIPLLALFTFVQIYAQILCLLKSVAILCFPRYENVLVLGLS